MGRRPIAALALVVAVSLGFAAERLAGPGGAWRSAARAAGAEAVSSHVGAHTDVVAGLARHFQEWEALVPEALERSLRVFGERFPALRRLLVADREGRVVAAFDTGARVGGERRLVGALDPSPARLKALVARRATHRASVIEAGTVDRIELGAPILAPDGSLRGYAAADLEVRSLCERLAQLEAQAGVGLGLLDADGRVVCPEGRGAPRLSERVPTAAGMTLWLRPPLWRLTALPAILLALALACGALLPGSRPKKGAAPESGGAG
ncbi:MAG: cache domain-containing protein [Deltaproteobacteria bacterium]|nr:cache domain-containing protein [Deltaproteobacteria bacterium]